MATLLEIGNILDTVPTDDLFKRFKAACTIAAKNVRAEDVNATNHANRLGWANAILSGDAAGVNARVFQHLRNGISTNATFQSAGLAVDDNAIQFIVDSQLDLLAV